MNNTLKLFGLCSAALCCLSGAAAEERLATFKVMKPELALELAQATLGACRKAGFQVAVAVVDRAGVTQVILRDQLAGAHTPETARRKAWTAVSFRSDTLTMAEETQAGKAQSGVRFVAEAMMIGGGIPVNAGGTMVGGVGVSGAPGGEEDHKCAQAGIDAVEESLMF
ncbi:MAG: heme-binding protein [Gammaproteobacteria bacterium]|nr:MAG: heme-binding protein [Gammaproteobacteria bacterium]